MKNKKYLFLSFIIPFLIYGIIFGLHSFFSDKMIILGDSANQYYPLFHYLIGVLEGTNSIFYSLSKGLGGSMFGTIFYYLSSPFNLLLIFVDKVHILDFITILTILKLSLCGFTMYIYMRKKFHKDSISILIFSILYSFIGYNLNYFLNIMWLDIVFLAPLVLLGIDNIIRGKSPLLYIIFLTISIISNYYIAYMLCIFSVLYFFYELILTYQLKTDGKRIKKIIITFFVSSLLCGLMCSFFLVPCILEMLNYGRSVSLKDIFTFDYNIFNLLAGTYLGGIDPVHPFSTYYINLYCGVITLPLVFLYFKNKQFSRKEKLLTLFIIVFCLLPCFIGVLNYIWHLFSIPIGFYYRYSFLLCLFLLIIAYRSFENLQIKKEDILSYLAIYLSYSVILMFIIYFKDYYLHLNYSFIWLTNIFLILYLWVLFKYKNHKKLSILIFIIVLIEVSLNVYILLGNSAFSNRTELKNYQEIVNSHQQGRMNFIDNDMGPFYNQSLMYSYYGTNSFLSTSNSQIIEIVQELGKNNNDFAEGQNNYLIYSPMAYIGDALLGVQTIVTSEELPYRVLNKIDNLYVYKNENALSLGYIIESSCNYPVKDFPFDEKVLNCIMGEENQYYKEYPLIENQYTIKKGFYFVYLKDINEKKDFFIQKFGQSIKFYTDNFLFLKNEKEVLQLQKQDFENEKYDLEGLRFYYFDYDLFQEKIENLKKEQLQYTITNNTLEGNITTEGGILMLTIPYEKGLNIYADGIPTNYQKVINGFVGIPLEPGNHSIKVTYTQPGLLIGSTMSIISTMITIIYIYKKRN